jgi:hypothetical protein
VEASPADVTWGARELQGQQQPSVRDRPFPPPGRLPPPAAAAAAFNTPAADTAGTESDSLDAASSSSIVGRGGEEGEEGGGSGHAPVARALFQDAARGPVVVLPGSLGSSPSRISKSYALQVASPLNDVPVCACWSPHVNLSRKSVSRALGGCVFALVLPVRARCLCPSSQERFGGRVRLVESEVATTPLDPCHMHGNVPTLHGCMAQTMTSYMATFIDIHSYVVNIHAYIIRPHTWLCSNMAAFR